MDEILEQINAAKFKAKIIDSNRDAFDLFRDTCSLIEAAITEPRDITEPYARALDLLFIQAYKSYTAVYFLAVRGHGEDAATILRRLLEISLQVCYLAKDYDERSQRGKNYLAYYWAQVPSLLKLSLDEKMRDRLQDLYKKHQHPLTFDRKGRANNWWCGTIRNLANRLGLVETYDQDYTFLSQMAHGTTQGVLVDIRNNRIEIRSDLMVREIWVFGVRYMLNVAFEWNNHFNLIDGAGLIALSNRALSFNFAKAVNRKLENGV